MVEGVEWEPRYNICPGEKKPAVTAVRLMDGKRQLVRLHWPLTPSWSKTRKAPFSTVNAMAERVAIAPAYRSAYRKRRCLILADAYVEWEAKDKQKLPWLYEVDEGRPFAFAGRWEVWRDPEQQDVSPHESCTIITTTGNDLTLRIHDRMPVILHEEDYADWLACEEIPLVPFPSDRMTARPYSTFINNTRNQGPECIEPREV
jgi:putative SOS response-associated peptidase YedK